MALRGRPALVPAHHARCARSRRAGHRMAHPPLRLERDPLCLLDLLLRVPRSRAGAVRQVEPDRVLHQHPLAALLRRPAGVRHPGPAGRHAVGHGAGHGAGRAAGAGRRRVHLRVLQRQTQGNPQNPHRASGGHPVDRVGIRRLHGAGAGDHQADRRPGGRESAQRRDHPGADERADHRLGGRGRLEGRARFLPRGGPVVGRQPLGDRLPRVVSGREERPVGGRAVGRRPRDRRNDGRADVYRPRRADPPQPVGPGPHADGHHRFRTGRIGGRRHALPRVVRHRAVVVRDHVRGQPDCRPGREGDSQ